MNRTAKALFQVSFITAILSTIGFVGVGVYQVIDSANGHPRDPVALSLLGLAMMVSGLTAVLAGWLDAALRQQKRQAAICAPKQPMIPLAPREKPDGYNEDVLYWFHNGPDNRATDGDFELGFNARAVVPPPKRRKPPC